MLWSDESIRTELQKISRPFGLRLVTVGPFVAQIRDEYEARIAELEAENSRFRLAIDACRRISEQGQKSLQTVSGLSVIIAEGSERNRQLVNELAQAQERIAELEGRAYSEGCQP